MLLFYSPSLDVYFHHHLLSLFINLQKERRASAVILQKKLEVHIKEVHLEFLELRIVLCFFYMVVTYNMDVYKKVGGNGNVLFSRNITFILKLMMIPEHLVNATKVQMWRHYNKQDHYVFVIAAFFLIVVTVAFMLNVVAFSCVMLLSYSSTTAFVGLAMLGTLLFFPLLWTIT